MGDGGESEWDPPGSPRSKCREIIKNKKRDRVNGKSRRGAPSTSARRRRGAACSRSRKSPEVVPHAAATQRLSDSAGAQPEGAAVQEPGRTADQICSLAGRRESSDPAAAAATSQLLDRGKRILVVEDDVSEGEECSCSCEEFAAPDDHEDSSDVDLESLESPEIPERYNIDKRKNLHHAADVASTSRRSSTPEKLNRTAAAAGPSCIRPGAARELSRTTGIRFRRNKYEVEIRVAVEKQEDLEFDRISLGTYDAREEAVVALTVGRFYCGKWPCVPDSVTSSLLPLDKLKKLPPKEMKKQIQDKAKLATLVCRSRSSTASGHGTVPRRRRHPCSRLVIRDAAADPVLLPPQQQLMKSSKHTTSHDSLISSPLQRAEKEAHCRSRDVVEPDLYVQAREDQAQTRGAAGAAVPKLYVVKEYFHVVQRCNAEEAPVLQPQPKITSSTYTTDQISCSSPQQQAHEIADQDCAMHVEQDEARREAGVPALALDRHLLHVDVRFDKGPHEAAAAPCSSLSPPKSSTNVTSSHSLISSPQLAAIEAGGVHVDDVAEVDHVQQQEQAQLEIHGAGGSNYLSNGKVLYQEYYNFGYQSSQCDLVPIDTGQADYFPCNNDIVQELLLQHHQQQSSSHELQVTAAPAAAADSQTSLQLEAAQEPQQLKGAEDQKCDGDVDNALKSAQEVPPLDFVDRYPHLQSENYSGNYLSDQNIWSDHLLIEADYNGGFGSASSRESWEQDFLNVQVLMSDSTTIVAHSVNHVQESEGIGDETQLWWWN